MIRDGDTVLLRLGEPASPAPAPVAALPLEHIANRDNNCMAEFNCREIFAESSLLVTACGRRGRQARERPGLPLPHDAVGYCWWLP